MRFYYAQYRAINGKKLALSSCFPNQHSSDLQQTVSLLDTTVAGYDDLSADFISLLSEEDHRLNPAIRTVAIENPQLQVCLSSSYKKRNWQVTVPDAYLGRQPFTRAMKKHRQIPLHNA